MSEWTDEDEAKAEALAKEFSMLGHHVSAPILMTALGKTMERVMIQTVEKYPNQRENVLITLNQVHDKLVRNVFGDQEQV